MLTPRRQTRIGREGGREASGSAPSAALAIFLVLFAPAVAASQDIGSPGIVDDHLVSGGSVRLSAWPSFQAWDQRFGDTGEGRVSLGAPLDRGSPLEIFPGSGTFVNELRDLMGDPAYDPALGSMVGRASHDVTRIDLGLHLGLTDWWTVGVTVPRIKNRTTVDMVFAADTLTGDLGVSPLLDQGAAVGSFLSGLMGAADAASARADGLCGAGDPGCASATALAEEAQRLTLGFETMYATVPLFPLEGSVSGTALEARIAALDAELQAAGLEGIEAPLVLATSRPTEGDLATLPVRFAPLGYTRALQTRTDLWEGGDIEVSTLLRLLRLGDRGGQFPAWTFDLLGGATVRLGTGRRADPDVPLALGSGDGQTDVEVRVAGHGTVGRTLSLRGGALYGVQGPRTVVLRSGTPDELLIPVARRGSFRWTPGRYTALEMAPGIRLTPELTLSATYRLFWRAGDDYQALEGTTAPVPQSTDVTLHQLGGGLAYDTTLPGLNTRPFRFRVRLLTAIGGRGGIPAAPRVELGAELFRRLWGG